VDAASPDAGDDWHDAATTSDASGAHDAQTQADAAGQGSGGCGATSPGGGTWTLEHDGLTRSFIVRLPSSYDPDTPTPLVLSFHGRATTASLQETVSGFTGVAEANDFIVVYPEGTGAQQTWNAGYCCGEAMQNDVDDLGFTAAMIDRLSAELCIDQRRVYANGLSNGGYFAYHLACNMTDRLAAIGSVAGLTSTIPCSPSRPIPVLHFHGDADSVVSYEGSIGALSAPQNAVDWAARNGCSAGPTVTFEQDDVSCETWSSCDDGAEVRLCTIEGGGHQWPGGFTVPGLGYNTDTVNASEELWTFYTAHALP
jgi:polyhydroxybutyrate depolymerase